MPLPSVLTNSSPTLEALQTANLVELFSAIQGEGLNVGTRQLFIRFAGCDLRCSYCDSAQTWHPTASAQIEINPGQRVFETVHNPVTPAQLVAWVERLDQPQVHDSVSLTGGEPLLHADFLQVFLPLLRQGSHLPIYLETGGHLPSKLSDLLPWLDLIGMDLKLPSVSGEEHWTAHRQFLQLAVDQGTEIFCKLIVSNQTTQTDLLTAADLIASVRENIPCFLQPMTPIGSFSDSARDHHGLALAPTPEQVLDWQVLMKQHLSDVRVIPQTHKMIHQK